MRKALRLFWKSNPAFVERIQSPIFYAQTSDFAAQVRAAPPTVYSLESGVHDYRSMAKSNFRGYLRTDSVPLKKYFYVLRPLLSIRWLERHRSAAPTEFERLLPELADRPDLVSDVEALLERKRAAPELGLAPPVRRP